MNKPCGNCGKQFEYMRVSAKFCSDQCRVKSSRSAIAKPRLKMHQHKQLDECSGNVNGKCPNNATTSINKTRKSPYKCMKCRNINSIETAVIKMRSSYFGKSLVSVIRQAGTIETFSSVDDIAFYHELNEKCRSYGSVSNGKVNQEYNRCHLVPASGDEIVGLTSKYNLVAGEGAKNKSNGNKELFTAGIEGSHFISKADLDSRWLVRMQPDHVIWEMVIERFGEALKIWAQKKVFKPPVKNDYKFPSRDKERLLDVMHGELFSEAGLTILYDLEPLFNFSSSWSDFQSWAGEHGNWLVNISKYGITVEHTVHGADKFLEPIGKLVQEFIFTGKVEFLEQADSELKKLQT
jgi:hypothetical protein